MPTPEIQPARQLEFLVLVKQRLLRECLAMALEGSGMPVRAIEAEAAVSSGFLDTHAAHGTVVVLTDAPELLGPLQTHPEVRPILVSTAATGTAADDSLRAGAWGCVDSTVAGPPELISTVKAVAEGRRGALSAVPSAENPRHSGFGNSPISQLTLREHEVLERVAAGEDNLQIASRLGIAERTVKAHVSSLYRKLGQENRAQLALFARRLGVRPAPESAGEPSHP